MSVWYHADTPIRTSALRCDLDRSVGGTVIDHYQLEIIERLTENTVYGFPKKSFAVVDRHEHRHQRPHLTSLESRSSPPARLLANYHRW
jgi:hypothetical protein